MNWAKLVESMLEAGTFDRIVNNPLAQFGPKATPYIGALFLPNKLVYDNTVKEAAMTIRSVMSSPNSRYSPVIMKGSAASKSQTVELADFDIGAEFSAANMDELNRVLALAGESAASAEAQMRMLNWASKSLREPHDMMLEWMRWRAIVDAEITLTYANNVDQVVSYSDPADHRFNAVSDWADDADDPMDDIMAAVEVLLDKGYTVNHIVMRQTLISALCKNDKIKSRAGYVAIASGTVVGQSVSMNLSFLNELFKSNNLPPITSYNARWRKQGEDTAVNGGYMLDDDAAVFIATTGRSEEIASEEHPIVLNDTLGYTGIGLATAEATPGIVSNIMVENRKPANITGESLMAGLPIITEDEAIAVIKNINYA